MITASLILLTAEETGQTEAQTKATLKAAFKIIRATVASGEAVRLMHDLGTFESRHISDGGEIMVAFTPTEAFQKEVNRRL